MKKIILISSTLALITAVGVSAYLLKPKKLAQSPAKVTSTTNVSKNADYASEALRVQDKTTRKNIIVSVLANIVEFRSNNAGKLPTSDTSINAFCVSLKSNTLLNFNLDPITDMPDLRCNNQGQLIVNLDASIDENIYTKSTAYVVFIGYGLKCYTSPVMTEVPVKPIKANSERSVAVWMRDAGGYECID
jgi:hypothetical protein